MSNLRLWEKFKTVPKEAQKKIGGGRLKGMTDISPMWRYMELTKEFGPCGIGWKYTIEDLWNEQGNNDQVCAFAKINLFVKVDKEWSDPIPGIGGSMMVAKETGGLHTSDECYKMAVTDALSVACKVLGMGASVHWFAGMKFSEQADGSDSLTDSQIADLDAMIDDVGADRAKFFAYFQIERIDQIPPDKFKDAVAMLEAKRGK